MSVRVSCPGCGGSVVFAVGSSMVSVCPYCRSVVARGDRSVENLGKVAELVETGAVLQVGTEGRYEGVKFRLTGRTQLGHEAGGVWDEWYASFSNGLWGWLAEAQGRYYLTFEHPDVGKDLPPYTEIEPDRSLAIAGTHFTVSEEGMATVKAAEGEIPYRLEPGRRYAYADLSGPDGTFATLDYSQSPPTVYVGKQVTLDELAVPPSARREVFQLRQVGGTKLGCPKCGGALDLKAPDQTERVGCPYCGSLLDCDQGQLKLLTALKKPKFKVVIPIGTVGKFGDDERTVIGALARSVTYDRDYYWYEYLLYHPRDGFEWLVSSDKHWSRVKAVRGRDVDYDGGNTASYEGETFRKFQDAVATVRGVIGECYWKVSVGETADTTDFIRPPRMLSREVSQYGESREVNWSLGTYLTPEQVQAAFGLAEPLEKPEGVGPNQPFPFKSIYTYGLIAFIALCVVGIVMVMAVKSRTVYEQTFSLRGLNVAAVPPPGRAPGPSAPPPSRTQEFFTDHFDLRAHRNVRVTVSAPGMTGWMVVEGDLVQQSDGTVQPFLVPLTYYAGTEDGEAWQEGSRVQSEYIGAQPAGQYSLRLVVERENPQPGTMTVTVEQGVGQIGNWMLTLLGVALIPVGVGLYNLYFSMQRWKDSDYSPYVS